MWCPEMPSAPWPSRRAPHQTRTSLSARPILYLVLARGTCKPSCPQLRRDSLALLPQLRSVTRKHLLRQRKVRASRDQNPEFWRGPAPSQKYLRADVPVNNPLPVCSIQRVGDLDSYLEHLFQFHWPTSDGVFQGFAFQKFHSDESSAVFFADVMNGADVRMVQRRSCLCLSLKPGQRVWVLRHVVREKFQCDEPMQARVFGLIHDTHAAPAQLLKDSVVRDGLADECVGVRHSTVMLCCKLRLVNESQYRWSRGDRGRVVYNRPVAKRPKVKISPVR